MAATNLLFGLVSQFTEYHPPNLTTTYSYDLKHEFSIIVTLILPILLSYFIPPTHVWPLWPCFSLVCETLLLPRTNSRLLSCQLKRLNVPAGSIFLILLVSWYHFTFILPSWLRHQVFHQLNNPAVFSQSTPAPQSPRRVAEIRGTMRNHPRRILQ